jgi:uncharacterized protein
MNSKKLLLALFCGIILTANVMAQNNTEDEWEMKTYYFVFLNAVANRPVLDSVKAAEIQAGHLHHINQMFLDGKCRLAGPFMDGGETRGILILDAASEEEAKELCGKDPAVINGRLIPVIKPWYGPAGLNVEKKAKQK